MLELPKLNSNWCKFLNWERYLGLSILLQWCWWGLGSCGLQSLLQAAKLLGLTLQSMLYSNQHPNLHRHLARGCQS